MDVKEAVELLEMGETVVIEVEGMEYDIGPADNFIGGTEGYISEVLGNIAYDDAEQVIESTIKFLEENGSKVRILE